MLRHRSYKDRPSIGEFLERNENEVKYHLPREAKIAWVLLIALAVAKYYHNIFGG